MRITEILYIDAMAGASGDMFLGALVDLGVDFAALRDGLKTLDVRGFDLVRSDTKRHTIAATKVDVVVEDVPHPHRHLGDLLAIIDRAALSAAVKERSGAVLRRLAEAESAAHRMPIEKVHLHEVGGLDCLVDVVGTVLGLELLGIERIVSGPVSVGAGFIRCAHGVMPGPAPGTLAILKDFPIRRTNIPFELTTPTGAAILAALASPHLAPVVMTPRAIGYGAGSRDIPQVANLLRLVRADLAEMGAPAHDHHHDDHDHDHGHDHSHDHPHEHHGMGHAHHHHDHDHEHDRGHEHGHHHHHPHDEPVGA
ncbi:MAG: LarC family nickel insertion protein [Sumerlaeia bacterium]